MPPSDDPSRSAARPPAEAWPELTAEQAADFLPSSVLPSAAVPPELLALKQYAEVRLLGRGGMGAVYLAKNTLLDRFEVLKVIGRELLGRPEVIDRFLREVRSAARLNHPNVVTAYTALPAGDLLVFAMEYVPGQNLAEAVKASGPLAVPTACYYVYQAALGLQHAHERGMVHRDIKPGNLMLSKDGRKRTVKVLDFGLAKATSENDRSGLTATGQMLGTPDYMAPEQTTDAATADTRADVYALGCTLHFLLTGKPPFSAKSLLDLMLAHREATRPRLDAARPDVPDGLQAVADRMLARRPEDRFPTPIEAARAILPFVKGGPEPNRPSTPPRPAASPAPAEVSTVGFQAPRTVGDPPPLPASPDAPPAGWDWRTVLIATGVAVLAVAGLIVSAVIGQRNSRPEPVAVAVEPTPPSPAPPPPEVVRPAVEEKPTVPPAEPVAGNPDPRPLPPDPPSAAVPPPFFEPPVPPKAVPPKVAPPPDPVPPQPVPHHLTGAGVNLGSARWEVQNGELVGRPDREQGHPPYLVTERKSFGPVRVRVEVAGPTTASLRVMMGGSTGIKRLTPKVLAKPVDTVSGFVFAVGRAKPAGQWAVMPGSVEHWVERARGRANADLTEVVGYEVDGYRPVPFVAAAAYTFEIELTRDGVATRVNGRPVKYRVDGKPFDTLQLPAGNGWIGLLGDPETTVTVRRFEVRDDGGLIAGFHPPAGK